MKIHNFNAQRKYILAVLTAMLFFPFINNAQLNVNSTNYVGIGTSSPAGVLDVLPTITTNTDLKGIHNGLVYNGGSTMTNWYGTYISAPTGTGTITNKYAFVSESGAGNVGIGTSSPGCGLHLNASGGTLRVANSSTPTTELIQLAGGYGGSGSIPVGGLIEGSGMSTGQGLSFISDGSGTTGAILGAYANGNGTWYPMWQTTNAGIGSDPNLLLVPTLGNVGIGTTSPVASLDIFTTSGFEMEFHGTNSTNINATASDLFLLAGTGKALNFGSNATNSQMVLTGGNVGIGTTAPGTGDKLDVQGGNINTSGNVIANGTVYTSDQKFKTNILAISNALSIINKLQPHSYYFDTANAYGMTFYDKKQYGLISQEVEQVLPELIYNMNKGATYDTSGNVITQAVSYKALNYNAFIPILMKGIQEQQAKIDSLSSAIMKQDSINRVRIDNLQSQITNCCNSSQGMKMINNNKAIGSTMSESISNAINDNTSINTTGAALMQNVPNPFNQQTSIQYNVPAISRNASIMVFDLQGTLLKTVPITNSGSGTITINGNELKPGMFVYSLIVDDSIVDTKRMILTQ